MTNPPGPSSCAVVLLCKAHGDAYRENQREVRKYRSSGVCDPFDVEQVGLSQTEQNPATGSTAIGNINAQPSF